jgi:hypothetical protein
VSEPINWWAPRKPAWWIGALFIIGSTCFALGSFPPYASRVGGTPTNVTFFIGSLFFTSAAGLQFQQSRTRLDWWAGLVQFIGTLFFNKSTFQALHTGYTATEANQHVWRPDALGSAAFLISSVIACIAVRRVSRSAPRDADWWAAWLNLIGSIAFGISAVASYTIVGSDTLVNAQKANLGTFVGAICFLAGAVLILPRRSSSRVAHRRGVRQADQ